MFVISLALGGSLGAAWLICVRFEIAAVPNDQRPAFCPIRFRLPETAKWTQDGIRDPVLISEDGSSGEISFVGIPTRGGLYELSVYFEANPIPSEADEPNVLIPLPEADPPQPIEVGPLDGRLTVRHLGHMAVLTARAWADDGLSFRIDLVALPYDERAMKIMRDICCSIEYQDWWMPRPELWPAS